MRDGLIAKAEASFQTLPKAVYTQGESIVYSVVYALYKRATDPNPFYRWIDSVVESAKTLGLGRKTITTNPAIAPVVMRETEVKPADPGYPEPINPTAKEFSDMMNFNGSDIIRAIAWQEDGNLVCDSSSPLK